MRQAVWRRLDRHVCPGDRVLELNCGTGEDAIHLAALGASVLATDVSPGMVDVARAKVLERGLAAQVSVRQLAIEDIAPDLGNEAPFDGVLSNFGGLNCVADLRAVARGLAQVVPPGGWVLLCVMGPLVPWEWAWYLGHGQVHKALRRLRPGGVTWRGLTIRYPSIRTLRRAMAADFRLQRVNAIGAFVPPSYAEAWAGRHPIWLERLDRWERRVEALPPLPWLADHYLAEFERRD
jgi:SAM-dependent methyltransferase